MAVTAALARQEPGCVDFQAGEMRQAFGRCKKGPAPSVAKELPHIAHSTGTTISLGRTILSRLRAAVSIVRGSLRKRSTSVFKPWLLLRNDSTSLRILTYCSEAAFIFARVRMVTVRQTANAARIIIPKITHEGMRALRRRLSARVPMNSHEISRTGIVVEVARGVTRCD